MTPNEKAQDLFVILLENTPDYIINDNEDAYHICKIHLGVVVNTLLKELNSYINECDYNIVPPIISNKLRFWNCVKEEIENI